MHETENSAYNNVMNMFRSLLPERLASFAAQRHPSLRFSIPTVEGWQQDIGFAAEEGG
ncbi:hypothetical protein TIFTF001_002654 [Ficus carica]|uniref:Uncharacterized protein n=1 Tax=Ficus carica TaxID=3494 RepID=A0AA88CU56_FICCA|nr:hypothetical protein TIFTF001_002654 [Ficus carica]